MRVLHRFVAVCLTTAFLGGFAFCADSGAASIFRQKCGKCHDNDGRPRGDIKMKVADLRAKEVQAMSDAQLYDTIAYGKNHREYPHAFLYTGLTKPQIESLVALIRTMK